MLKNVFPFALSEAPPAPREIESAFSQHPYREMGSLEMFSAGFVPPLGNEDEKAPLLVEVDGYILFAVIFSEKKLPTDAVKHELQKKVRELESRDGRKVGRKELLEIREGIETALIPRLIPRRRKVLGYFSPGGRFVVASGTLKKATDVTDLVRMALGSLPVTPWIVEGQINLVSLMTSWLGEEESLPDGFSLGEDAVLQEEERGSARLSRQDLGSEDTLAHLEAGKQVTRLGLSVQDCFNFSLDESGALLKISESDVLSERILADAGDESDLMNLQITEFLIKAREIDALLDQLLDKE